MKKGLNCLLICVELLQNLISDIPSKSLLIPFCKDKDAFIGKMVY